MDIQASLEAPVSYTHLDVYKRQSYTTQPQHAHFRVMVFDFHTPLLH